MDRKDHKALRAISFIIILFAACKKDKPQTVNTLPPQDTNNKVYVVCEGSFGSGNSSLSVYDYKQNIDYGDVYRSANNGESLGDVFQSMQLIGDRYFLCINNSDKIVVINRTDKKKAGTISIPKPRYILPVAADKAYVSTLFSNKVYIINLQDLSIKGTINMPFQNPEGMLLLNDKAYICTWDTACNKIYQVDITTDAIVKEIPVAGFAPQEPLVDKLGNIWILSGNATSGKQATLTCLDAATGSTLKSYNFPKEADPIRPAWNRAKDKMYFIEVNYTGGTDNNGVYAFDINSASLPAIPLIPAVSLQYFWAVGIEPKSGDLYVGDPKGFTQKGAVYVYDSLGNKVNSFPVGVGPGHFYFDN